MASSSLQDQYLNAIRKENIPATFYLMNGFQLKGLIKAFDQYTIILDSDKKQELIFKHAISTIIPTKPIDLMELA